MILTPVEQMAPFKSPPDLGLNGLKKKVFFTGGYRVEGVNLKNQQIYNFVM